MSVESLLVENRNAAERAALPFGDILFHLGVQGLEEGAHEGGLEFWTDNRTLLVPVTNYKWLMNMVNNRKTSVS